MITNATIYRSLINGETINNERSVSFEPDEIVITIYTNESIYQQWLKRKGETVNFKMTETNIDLQLIIRHVILAVRLEHVMEVLIKLWSLQRVKEHNEWMKK
jgi:hypothetical protein